MKSDANSKEVKTEGPKCKVCNNGRERNKTGVPEPLVICGTCKSASKSWCKF